jgi:hypothetical protein
MDLRETGWGVWSGFTWLSIGNIGGLLWTRWWTVWLWRHGVSTNTEMNRICKFAKWCIRNWNYDTVPLYLWWCNFILLLFINSCKLSSSQLSSSGFGCVTVFEVETLCSGSQTILNSRNLASYRLHQWKNGLLTFFCSIVWNHFNSI